LAQRAKAERRRYHAARDQDAEVYERLDDGVVIDYTVGCPRPGELKPQYRGQNPRHDSVTRFRLDHAAQIPGADDDVPGVRPWAEIRAIQHHTDDRVEFLPETATNPFYARTDDRQIVNWLAEVQAYRPASRAGEQALFEHITRRR
jgi:hypothetical protein